jgi:putative addiction module antidote
MKLEVKKIGNSKGVILPKELLSRLRLDEGSNLYATEGPDRSLTLSPYDPEHEAIMEISREVMSEYQDTFKALAK